MASSIHGNQAAPSMRSMCTIWAVMYPAKAKVTAPKVAAVDETGCRLRKRYVPSRATS